MKKHNKITVVPHRRRREGRTDYRLRLRLLKSGKSRVVIRRSNKHTLCQVVSFNSAGDTTLATADSKELNNFGWKGCCSNLPAAYLTGLLCGTRAKGKNVSNCVLDLGLQSSTKASVLYAALQGILDSGLDIPHSEKILPTPERLSGKHIADFATLLKKEDTEKYKKMFSSYLKSGVDPENLPVLFEQSRAKIKGAPAAKGKPEKKRTKRPEKPI